MVLNFKTKTGRWVKQEMLLQPSVKEPNARRWSTELEKNKVALGKLIIDGKNVS